MYNRGCLIISPAFIADPDIFDAIADAFKVVRHLEVNEEEHILIVEHPEFMPCKEGDYLVFYDPIFQRTGEGVSVKEIGAPYIHNKYFLQCQNQKETPKNLNQESNLPLI